MTAGLLAVAAAPFDLGRDLPAWSALPFLGILLSIALGPLVATHFWHEHYPKIAAAWAVLFLVPFVWIYGAAAGHEIAHTALLDYVPFLILLSALFVIGGGIHVKGSLRGTPKTNTAILAIGTLIASFVGTTGAAMILIRPLLRANRRRIHRSHTVVFFIFLVANIGGALTPLGDPPLFLGFLRGVPFTWTFSLATEWALVGGLVLATYFVLDTVLFRRDLRRHPELLDDHEPVEPLGIGGGSNLVLLLFLLAAVLLSGMIDLGQVEILGVKVAIQNLLRDAILLVLIALSWKLTPRRIRAANQFSWAPIREVAILFAAIFSTIIPALAILRAGEAGALAALIRAVQSPAQYFWAAGGLSAFLDNAPTYLTFLSTAVGRLYPGVPEAEAIHRLIAEHESILKAISTGAVFMGAATYIGNAPNFMVKAIAEEAGIEMPSFFGFLVRYTLPFLVPVFLIATWIFFH